MLLNKIKFKTIYFQMHLQMTEPNQQYKFISLISLFTIYTEFQVFKRKLLKQISLTFSCF